MQLDAVTRTENGGVWGTFLPRVIVPKGTEFLVLVRYSHTLEIVHVADSLIVVHGAAACQKNDGCMYLKVAAADEEINRLARRRLNGLHCFVNLIQLSVTTSLDCHLPQYVVKDVNGMADFCIEPAIHVSPQPC